MGLRMLMQTLSRQDELADPKAARPEVRNPSMLQSCRPQISRKLRDVFARDCVACLDLHEQATLHQQIRNIVPQDRPIFVIDLQRILRLDLQARLAQAVRKPVLVHLLQVSAAQMPVQRIARLPDQVAHLQDILRHGRPPGT